MKEIDRKDARRDNLGLCCTARNYITLIYGNPLHSPLIKHERPLYVSFTRTHPLPGGRLVEQESLEFQLNTDPGILCTSAHSHCLFMAGCGLGRLGGAAEQGQHLLIILIRRRVPLTVTAVSRFLCTSQCHSMDGGYRCHDRPTTTVRR